MWKSCSNRDLNPWPPAFRADALQTELSDIDNKSAIKKINFWLQFAYNGLPVIIITKIKYVDGFADFVVF